MFVLLGPTFTAAILTADSALCEDSSSAILKRRGDTFLFPGAGADRHWGVPHLARSAVAGVRAASAAHRSGFLCAARGGAVPLQRNRAGIGTESCRADGIRTAELRTFFYPRFRVRCGKEHHRARGEEFASESPSDPRRTAKRVQRKSEQSSCCD